MLMQRAPERGYPESVMPLESEMMMLSMLLNDNRRVDSVADILLPDDFADPLFGRIYARIVELVSAGQQANALTVHPLMERDEGYGASNGRQFLAEISGSTSIAAMLIRPKDGANIITECAARRRLIDETKNVTERAADRTVSLPALVDQTDAALVATIERREESREDSLSGSIARAIKRVEQIKANDGRIGASTGIEEFDQLLGGVEPGQVIIVAGRPGMGKTALACSTALGWARRGHGVLFASLEMRSEELGMRMVSDLCCRGRGRWIPFSMIVNGTVGSGEISDMCAAEHAVQSWPLRIRDFSSATLARLSLAIRRSKRQMAARGQKLEVVIVDYLQLLHPDDPRASAYEAVSQISKGLKAIAKDLEVAIIALAQLSRAVESREDKRPQLADLRDSGQIEQDADAVVFLYREEYYLERTKAKPGQESAHEDAKHAAAGKLSLICAKRRNGPIANATCQYLAPYQAVRSSSWGR